jgi:hypothetical protein
MTPRRLRAPAAALLGALALAAPLGAQTWRTLDVSRQLHDSTLLQVKVQYGAGRLNLHAAAARVLYDMRLRYDAERTEPLHSFSQSPRALRLGVRKQNVKVPGDRNPAEMRLDLADAVPMELSLELGAVEADLDLSRLRLHRLDVQTGASEATLRFDSPNPEPMTSMRLELGAASLKALRLANANSREIIVDAGVGNVDLDFGGEWTQDVTLDVEVALGGVHVNVPSDVGVRVEMQKVLGSFEHDGLTKRDGAYYSENWETARHKLRIRAETTLGKFELNRR